MKEPQDVERLAYRASNLVKAIRVVESFQGLTNPGGAPTFSMELDALEAELVMWPEPQPPDNATPTTEGNS